jgi:hypothetical protein
MFSRQFTNKYPFWFARYDHLLTFLGSSQIRQLTVGSSSCRCKLSLSLHIRPCYLLLVEFLSRVYERAIKIYLDHWISFIWIHLCNRRHYIAMQVLQTLTDGAVPSQDLISSVKNLYSKTKVLYCSVPELTSSSCWHLSDQIVSYLS